MNTITRGAAVALSLVCVGSAVSACGSGDHSQNQSFAYSGKALAVVNDNPNMPVSVSVRDGAKKGEEVTVSVATKTMGKGSETPSWSLDKGTLSLGTPCGKGWVGYCEGSYTVTVPRGVSVSVNGKSVAAG